MNKLDLSVIILTYNEEIHIERCLSRLSDFVKDIFIIDSFSTDNTLSIAKKFPNVSILQNKWINYASQFNWGLNNACIKTKWVLRMDADEYLEEDTIKKLKSELPTLPDSVSAIDLRLKHYFLGRFLKGGTGTKYMTRIFKYGKARSEVRQMDEHLVITDGMKIVWQEAFVDDNLNNLSWWTNKHNGYAIREAVDLLDIEYEFSEKQNSGVISEQAALTRQRKLKYAKQPLFLRSFLYFLYRYFAKMGFLEGKEGFIWCFLQGWWYRTLVDAKIFEIKKICKNDKTEIKKLLETKYGIIFNKS